MATETHDEDQHMRFEDYENCERCPELYKLRTQIVWGFGNEQCDILFIGEGPGENEDLDGKPFVGEAGRFLSDFLEQAEIPRSEVYLTNTVLCRPTRPGTSKDLTNRPPTPVEVASCLPRLHKEIIKIDPVIIVALGDVAASALYGKKLGIKKFQGTVLDINIRTPNDLVLTYAMMPVFHPSYLLRTQSRTDMYETVKNLRRVKRVADRYKATLVRNTL